MSEAATLEARARLPYSFDLPFGSFKIGPDSDALRNEAASKRARAAQLLSEASELDGRFGDTAKLVHDPSVRGVLGGSNSVFNNPAEILRETNPGTQDFGAFRGNTSSAMPKPHKPVTIDTPSVNRDLPPGGAPNVSTDPPATLPTSPAASFAVESGKIDGLIQGSAAVSAPSTAKEDDSFSVFLRVSPEKLATVIQTLKDEFPENQTVKGRQGIKLTPRMMASVSGFGFEVDPKDGKVQPVSATDATTWAWQVKAIESGLHTLMFTLSSTLTIEGKEVARNYYYRQQVQVEVNPKGFLRKYWQWLVTTLAIPAIGALWAVFRKPKDGGGNRQPSLAEKLRERRRLRATG